MNENTNTDNQGWEIFNQRSQEIIQNKTEVVKSDFLTHTRSIKEILQLPSAERPDVEITCIDERAVISVRDIKGNLDIVHINTPGGGTEFLEDEDIDQIIMLSNGNIKINSHLFCGWGEYIFNQILNGDESNEERQSNKSNGITRIMNSVKLALDDSHDVFWKSYLEDFEGMGIGKTDLMNQARRYVSKVANNENLDDQDNKIKDLVLQAFVHGKTIKLATRFEQSHEKLINDYNELKRIKGENEKVIEPPLLNGRLNIVTYIDTLENAPHQHIADSAIINMTRDKVFTSRFPVGGKDAFFARVGFNKSNALIDLIFKIMEGDHSDSKDLDHNIYVCCDEADKLTVENLIKGIAEVNSSRKVIVIGLSEEELNRQQDPLPPS